jgi:hypothetical protein
LRKLERRRKPDEHSVNAIPQHGTQCYRVMERVSRIHKQLSRGLR